MTFTDLQQRIRQCEGAESSLYESVTKSYFYGHVIRDHGSRFSVDGRPVSCTSLDEVHSLIKEQRDLNRLNESLLAEQYDVVPLNKVAEIIRTHHKNVRISDKLIESYIELAASKAFTTDPVVHDIRRFNRFDQIIENHFDYLLEDGSTVLISEATQEKLNSLIGQHPDMVQYMREDKHQFLRALNTLIED